ncbi:MAG: methyltransferase regulatory domain-containing protein [Thermomicrobiales bacterium]
MGTERNAYDEIAYPGFALPQTHPDRLATLATLFGMRPAPIDRCRVLELGCGDGANLIPMAFGLPESTFVGIDLAARPIAKGAAMATALGLHNIALHQQDILSVSERIGTFDYIIAHGLYSWVPPPVQEKILAICAAHLRPDGVAYVSYNTYPGGRLREITREMMTFHTRGVTDPRDKIARAREIVRTVADAQPGEDGYSMIQRAQHEQVSALSDGSIFHDYLADVNAPVYFHQFMQRAMNHDLQYLAEAEFFDMQTHGYPSPVAEALRDLGTHDRIAKEQYLDFLRGRAFRQTLLCHQRVPLDRTLDPDRVMSLSVASPVQANAPAPDIHSVSAEEFRGIKGGVMTTNHPVSKAALLALGRQWPRAIPFPDLLTRARSHLGQDVGNTDAVHDEDARVLADMVIGAYAAGLVELHLHPPPLALHVSAKPLASPLARLQLRDGSIVTTLRHTSVRIDDRRAHALLRLLDGTRDRAALLSELNARLGADAPDTSGAGDNDADVSAQELERELTKMARLALLIA